MIFITFKSRYVVIYQKYQDNRKSKRVILGEICILYWQIIQKLPGHSAVIYIPEKHNYHNDTRNTINAEALAALQAYSFPGNVR